MIEKLGGRKVVAGLVTLLVGVTVAMVKGDVPPNLQQLLEVIFGALVLGNGAEHMALAIKSRASVSQTPKPVSEPSVSQKDIDELKQSTAATQEIIMAIVRRMGIDKMPEPK